MHQHNLNRQHPGTVFDKNMLSIMIIDIKHENDKKDEADEIYLLDLVYMNLKDAYDQYIVKNNTNYPEPYHQLPVFNIDVLKKRVIYKTRYNEYLSNIDNHVLKIDDCYERYWKNECDDNEMVFLENELSFDDKMLVDWVGLENEYKLREQAVKAVQERSVGSWLVRRSSVKESEHVKVRVFTIKTSQSVINYLCLHIDGFGYVSTGGVCQGDVIAKIGQRKTIKIFHKFESLVKLLDHIKQQFEIKMEDMIQNGTNYVVTAH
jgi:hypothetical protein